MIKNYNEHRQSNLTETSYDILSSNERNNTVEYHPSSYDDDNEYRFLLEGYQLADTNGMALSQFLSAVTDDGNIDGSGTTIEESK